MPTFRAVLQLNGKTATGIEVPQAVVDELGGAKRPTVRVSIGAGSFSTTLGSMGGNVMIPVNGERRAACGVEAGQELDVTLVLDDAPREVIVPDDLAAALAEVPGARDAFDRLAYSHRKEHVRAIDEAKAAETRQRRIAKCVEKVTGA